MKKVIISILIIIIGYLIVGAIAYGSIAFIRQQINPIVLILYVAASPILIIE